MDYQWIILYLLINGIVFLIYGLDKWKASHHRWRIPEHTLMLFHHKTHKPKFYIGVPAIFILEVIAAAAMIYFLYA